MLHHLIIGPGPCIFEVLKYRLFLESVCVGKQELWFDAEHPMDIPMSRVRLASDTCDLYFTYTKVNHPLYTCSLDPFGDVILLDTPLVCIHRYCRNTTHDEEECERKCTLHHPRGKLIRPFCIMFTYCYL